MSLLDDIKEIQNNCTLPENKTPSWVHNENIIKILKESGEYIVPAPKTYITVGYVPPSNINAQLNLPSQYQFYGRINPK